MRSILSQQNPNYKRWRQILETRGIKKFTQTMVSGRKIVPEVLQQQKELVREILVNSETMAKPWSLEDQKSLYCLEPSHFKELDTLGTEAPLLVLDIPKVKTWNPDKPPQGLELMVAMSDPANLGAVIRSAEAFDVSKVILLSESAHAFHPKVTKTSSGSNLRIPLVRGPSIKGLSDQSLWALDMHGEDLRKAHLPENMRLLIGEEGQGVPKDTLPNHRLSIPIAPTVESLNAAVAASLAIYQILSSRASGKASAIHAD